MVELIIVDDYPRSILSLWLRTIRAIVAGITTISVPRPILNRKLANEGVIFFSRLFLASTLIVYVVL